MCKAYSAVGVQYFHTGAAVLFYSNSTVKAVKS